MKIAYNHNFGVLTKTKGEQNEWNKNCRNKNEIKFNSTNYVVLRVYEIDFSIIQALIS